MTSGSTRRRAPLLFLGALLTLSAPLYGAPGDLPEMGDSSATVLSQEDERRIGREMMRQLEGSGIVNHDPLINDYIQGVGRSLSAAAVSSYNHFQFFVVNASSINAFAMPGGYIGVHAGLILASDSENELASVLAHEIAHVTQHHIARSVEKANQMNLPITAAVIAAILLGGGDPQVANAALAASVGGTSQMQLDFTRSNEQEADRVGMQLLAVSDYDPRGMSDFFSRLQEDSRYYGSGVPEFLRTHPVTTSRIAEAEDRARQYPRRERQDSIHYHLVKARLRLQQAESLEALAREVENEAADSPQAAEARHYLQALIQAQLGNYPAARQQLDALHQQYPGRIAHIHALATLEEQQGQHQRAAELYQQALRQYPGNLLLATSRVRALIAAGSQQLAREQLEQLLREQPNHAEAYQLLAQLEAESGNRAASYLAQAEFYYLRGEAHSAIDQLNMARRLEPQDHYYISRIEARLKQLEQELSLSKSTHSGQ